jgi:phosphohistidine phosphatase
MRTLYLLRHAKSSWKDQSLADFERPLAKRGQEACGLIVKVITEKEIEFDLALSSTALRARQTIELISRQAWLQTELRFDERIYDASVADLVQVTSQIENDRKSVLLVGHNPGLEELLQALTGVRETLPTAALAKLKLKISKWSDNLESMATLEWIVRPREL